MPPTSSQQQTPSHTQNYSTFDPGYVRGSAVRAVRTPWHRRPQQPNYMPTRPARPAVTPDYDPQPPTQDGFTNLTPTQFGRVNDACYQCEYLVNGFNYDTFGIGAPPPWNDGEYPPPQVQYGHLGQGGINHTGSPFVAEPLPDFATNPSQPFPGTSAAPNNQGASPVWNLSGCGVAYEGQDELRLTIVFKKAPST
ncbi:hypothetical protein EDB86DRAFT_1926870 [Lactarius hatsudake]|nr:hypothetical protein EDB86DRAFT_1926870 [Lactarius hatsudake]